MKSRCLLNSCNSTSQFISIMFRCSCFFLVCLFFCFFFYQIKNFLFLLWVNLCMITGIYLHDPPPFNGPFFMTPPFSESKKVVTLPLFPPPTPLLISDKSLIQQLRLPRRIRQNPWLHAARLPFLIYCNESAHTKTRRLVFKKMIANLEMGKFSGILTSQLSNHTALENPGKSGLVRLKTTL